MNAHRVHRPLHVACNKVDQNNRLLKVLFSGGIGGKCTCSDVFDGSVYLSPMMAPAEKVSGLVGTDHLLRWFVPGCQILEINTTTAAFIIRLCVQR